MIGVQTSKPKAKNTVQLKVDAGSQCDIHPASTYAEVTGDKLLQCLTKCNKEIVSYTGEHRKITGKVKLLVWFEDQQRTLNFNIIKEEY